MWPRLRQRLDALLLCAAFVPLLAPIALGRSFWRRDVAIYTYPMKLYVRERLLAGALPLWNPRIGLGQPFLGLIQPGVFYPGNVVLLLLPVPLGLDVFMAAHLVVAAFGARAWLRALGADRIEAATAGALLGLSGYLVGQVVNNGAYAFGAAWVPWALVQVARAPEAATARALGGRAAAFGLVLALALSAGDPMAVYFAGGLALAQSLGAGSRAAVGRSLAVVALGAALGALCALVQLLPAAEVATLGRSGGVDFAAASHSSLHPARLLEFVWPFPFGEPYGPRWFVRALVAEGGVIAHEPNLVAFYPGLATVPLALAALSRGHRRPVDLAFAALALAALGVALGRFTPLWAAVHGFVPGARYFRFPDKYLFVTVVALVPLAARGLAVAAGAPRRAARWAAGGLLALVTAAVLASAYGPALALGLVGDLGGVSPADAGAALALCAWASAGLGALYVLVLVAGARGALAGVRLRAALGALVVVDLAVASLPLGSWAPSAMYQSPSPWVGELRRAAGGDLTQARLYRPQLVGARAEDAWPAIYGLLRPNFGSADGVTFLDAYAVLHPPREARVADAFRAEPVRMLQWTGTRFALLRAGQVGPGLAVVARRGFGGDAVALVEVPGVAARAYLAARAVTAGGPDEAARRLLEPGLAPGHDAVVEGGEARASGGECAVTAYAPERVALRCRAERPAYAVVNDAFLPGWRATVNGRPAPILPANVAMRAVPIPAGVTEVVMEYHPRGLGAGAAVSAAALALCLGLLVRAGSRPGSRPGSASAPGNAM